MRGGPEPPPAPAGEILGAVDLTAVADSGSLGHIEGSEEFLYVSGMAIAPTHRRSGGAMALLEAAERLAVMWGFRHVALHVHEDNEGARCLYQRAGYAEISADAVWATTWLGRRRRVLLAKRPAGAAAATAAAAGGGEETAVQLLPPPAAAPGSSTHVALPEE